MAVLTAPPTAAWRGVRNSFLSNAFACSTYTDHLHDRWICVDMWWHGASCSVGAAAFPPIHIFLSAHYAGIFSGMCTI